MGKNLPLVVLITGKRYVGKDTIAQLLKNEFDTSGIFSIIKSTSLGLKSAFCTKYCLDENLFLTSRSYKEKYRSELAKFAKSRSKYQNFQQLLREINSDLENGVDIVVIPDLRTIYDFNQFKKVFSRVIVIRVTASNSVRRHRGWIESDYDGSSFEKEQDQIPADFELNNDTQLNLSTLENNHDSRSFSKPKIGKKPRRR